MGVQEGGGGGGNSSPGGLLLEGRVGDSCGVSEDDSASVVFK